MTTANLKSEELQLVDCAPVNEEHEAIIAFLMAHHPRLGANSDAQKIPKQLVAKIYSFIRRLSPSLATKKLDLYFRQEDPDTWDELVLQIMAAADSRVNTLTLETKSLASIPTCIGKCTELKKLALRGDALVTLPPQIGNLTELSHLQTYCCGVLFYPFELLNCKKLHVHGNSLYIDLRSLLGRRDKKFPSIPSAIESRVGVSQEMFDATREMLDLAGIDAAMCSWCRTAWPSSEFTSWLQGRFPGGDRRDVLPLLARFCSQACLDNARRKHNPSEEELGKAKMISCVEHVVAGLKCPKDRKKAVCHEMLRIVQSNS